MANRYLNAFKNSKSILEGIKNSLFKREHVEAEAQLRFEICRKCASLDSDGIQCLMPGTEPCCSECGCSLDLKTRSLSSECPLKKWPALMTEEEENALIEKITQDDEQDNKNL